MGEAFSKEIFNLEKPTIGFIKYWVRRFKRQCDSTKGDKISKRPKRSEFFFGFVEGNDITLGTTDIVVTDGFTGNVALKPLKDCTSY